MCFIETHFPKPQCDCIASGQGLQTGTLIWEVRRNVVVIDVTEKWCNPWHVRKRVLWPCSGLLAAKCVHTCRRNFLPSFFLLFGFPFNSVWIGALFGLLSQLMQRSSECYEWHWIRNGSGQSNILFCLPSNKDWYRQSYLCHSKISIFTYFLHFFLCLNLLCSLFCVFIYISNIVFILLSCVSLAALTFEINKVYIILYKRAKQSCEKLSTLHDSVPYRTILSSNNLIYQ